MRSSLIVAATVLVACTSTDAPAGSAAPVNRDVAPRPEARAPETSPPAAVADAEVASPPTPVEEGAFRPLPVAIPDDIAACERDWVLAASPPAELTARCVDTYLKLGYGDTIDAEALTLDPSYGSVFELRYTRAQLRGMAARVRTSCESPDDPETRCARAIELLDGMASRVTSLFEDVNVETIAGPLAKVLAGERLTESDVWLDHEELGYSPLSLRKLSAAVRARHGHAFADEDLAAFFYDERPEDWAERGLPALTRAEAITGEALSEVDRQNLELLKRAEARANATR
ncbi:MAG: hypothetical protein H6713_37165 [Myxococcales bacterium]|nr:hypothetical protein [Myxococcales bacterium]